MACAVCGYDLHVEVCHIKDIKWYPDDTLVAVINHLDNLVALCKNHHWEFDSGHLSDPNIGLKSLLGKSRLGTFTLGV